MSDQPLVSIIIPTYNRAHLIGETLDSVVAQTYLNWECIIVDDGSSDNTDEVVGAYVEKDARFKYFHRPEEHLPGGNGARNYGFKMSQGEYIQWFDSDDLMLKEKIAEQYKDILKEKSDLQICTGFKDKEGVLLPIKQNLKISLFKQFALNKTEILTPTALFKKKFLKKNDIIFNEKIKRGQEAVFFLDVLSKIMVSNVHQSSKKLFVYKLHNSSISGKDRKFSEENSQSKFFLYKEIFNNNKKTYQDDEIKIKMLKKMARIFLTSIYYNDPKATEYYNFLIQNLNRNLYKIKTIFCYYKCIGFRSIKIRNLFNNFVLKNFS
jgi:glycosyltransferase involved in cell wall biosynthesis